MENAEIEKAKAIISKLKEYCFCSQRVFKGMGFDFTESDFICLENLLDNQNAKIARLHRCIESQERTLEAFREPYKEELKVLKEVTIKDFAERLKATFPARDDSRCTLDDCYTLDAIDNIAKELMEGSKQE